MSNYEIYESVQNNVRVRIHDYEDLGIHHPTEYAKNPNARIHAQVDGDLEEVLSKNHKVIYSQEGHEFVSKDIILQNAETHSKNGIPVPSPTSGYIKIEPSLGRVMIYDQPNGEMIAQVQHMDLKTFKLKNGDHVEYGQPLGVQAGMGRGNLNAYPVHTHIDFNVNHLDKFKKYIQDIDSGVITTDKYPTKIQGKAHSENPPLGMPPHAENALSKPHQSLIADSEKHVHQLYKEHGLTIDGGTHHTVMSVAVAAAEQGMTRIDRAAVKDGNINVAQMDGAVATVVSVNGNVAANTPVEQSLIKLASIEQSQAQSINNPSQTIEQPKQVRSMG